MMEYREMAVLAFNVLNGLMICLAIFIAGFGTYIWQTEIPAVSAWHEKVVESQGLVSGLLGAIVSVLAWLGTFGVNNEKPKLISAYIVIFGLLVIPTVVLAILTMVYISKWTTAAQDDMYLHMEKYYTDAHSANVTDAIQLGYRCCGLNTLPASYRGGSSLPASCCDPVLFLVTKETAFCDAKFKFKRTCEGVLTEDLVYAVKWLSSLLLLLAAFFIALLVDLHFVRRPSKKSVGKNKDAPPASKTVPDRDAPPNENKEKKPLPDRGKDSPQKTV